MFTACAVKSVTFCFSAHQSREQLSADPGLALLCVCAAVLLGVNAELILLSTLKDLGFCADTCRTRLCEQDDHSEGAQQHRSPRDVLHVRQRSQHGGETLRPSSLRRLQPGQLPSSPEQTRCHRTAPRLTSRPLLHICRKTVRVVLLLFFSQQSPQQTKLDHPRHLKSLSPPTRPRPPLPRSPRATRTHS